MIEKGTLIRCQTRTKGDVFGNVLWEVVETGLPSPEKGRENENDGISVVLLGGSGPRAMAGMRLIDSEHNIEKDIASGITTIVPKDQRDAILARYAKIDKDRTAKEMPRHGGKGVVELG